MIEDMYYVIAFDSTHYAIQGEKALKERGLAVRTIPTPREITASCGLSIKFDVEALNEIKMGINEYNLSIEGIYEIRRTNDGKYSKRIL